MTLRVLVGIYILHDMGGYAPKGGFSKHCVTSHIKEFGFPTIDPGVHVVYDALAVPVLGLRVK